jgi:hypothetical protein
MLERITSSVGALPGVMTMDAGYWSKDNARACADQGIDAYGDRCPRTPTSKPAWPASSDAKRIQDLRPAQGDRGAGKRPDHGSPGSATVPAERRGEGRCRMAPDRCHPQPAQVVPVHANTATRVGSSDGMRGQGPWRCQPGRDKRAFMGLHSASRRGIVINAVKYHCDRWAGALSAINS